MDKFIESLFKFENIILLITFSIKKIEANSRKTI